MATNMRTALAAAVVETLSAALPDATVARGRRAEVGIDEMPLIQVATADATPDDTMSPGETFWTLAFSVTADLAYQAGDGDTLDEIDAATEDALGDMEASIIAALHAQDLDAPSGGPLTCGIEPQGSSIEITEVASTAKRIGRVSLDFRAQLVLPVGTTSFP